MQRANDPSSQVSPKNKYLNFHFKNTACLNESCSLNALHPSGPFSLFMPTFLNSTSLIFFYGSPFHLLRKETPPCLAPVGASPPFLVIDKGMAHGPTLAKRTWRRCAQEKVLFFTGCHCLTEMAAATLCHKGRHLLHSQDGRKQRRKTPGSLKMSLNLWLNQPGNATLLVMWGNKFPFLSNWNSL